MSGGGATMSTTTPKESNNTTPTNIVDSKGTTPTSTGEEGGTPKTATTTTTTTAAGVEEEIHPSELEKPINPPTEVTSSIPIHIHHAQPTSSTTTTATPTNQPPPPHLATTPTTTLVTVVSAQDEKEDDMLRANYANKSFYHLNMLNDETIDKYCNYYGASTEGTKYAKLARLISHFPNFARKGMERFTLDSLKEMCFELKLSIEGKKSILIDRLFDYYMSVHKKDSLEITVDNNPLESAAPSASTSSSSLIPIHHIHAEEEVVPPLRKSTRKKTTSTKSTGLTQPRVEKRKTTAKPAAKKDKEEEEEEEEAEEEVKTTKRKKQKTATTAEESTISKTNFMKKAKDLEFTVDGKDRIASKKLEMTHGSFGWHYSGKSKVKVGTLKIPVTVTLNVTVNKSGRKTSD